MAERVYGRVTGVRLDGRDARERSLVKESTSIGRHPDCDIPIDNPLFSRKHCAIEVAEDQKMRLVNHSTMNQTLVNGTQVTGPVILEDMDIITLADRDIRFEYPYGQPTVKRTHLEVQPAIERDKEEDVVQISSSDDASESESSFVFPPAVQQASGSAVTRSCKKIGQAQAVGGPSAGAAANPVVADDDDFLYEVDPAQHAPVAGPSRHTLPYELQDHDDAPFDSSDSDEDNQHINQWRDGDLGVLAVAINFYRSQLKGRFVGTGGGAQLKREAWEKVANYVNSRCNTLWTVPQCKTKVTKQCLSIKEKIRRNNLARNRTGGGEIEESMDLTETDEMFMDWVGVEGVVGVPGIHGVSLEPDTDQGYLDDRQQALYKEWDFQRDNKPAYKELQGGFIKLPKKTPAKKPTRKR